MPQITTLVDIQIEVEPAHSETSDYAMPVRIGAAEAQAACGFRYYRVEHQADGQWVRAALAGSALPEAVVPNSEGD